MASLSDMPWNKKSLSQMPWNSGPGGSDKPLSGSIADTIFTKMAVGRVMSQFGQGAAEGWGATMHALAPDEEKALHNIPDLYKSYQDGNNQTSKTFNEAFTRPSLFSSMAQKFAVIPAAGMAALSAIGRGGEQIGREATREAELRKQDKSIIPDVVGPLIGQAGEMAGAFSSGQYFPESIGLPNLGEAMDYHMREGLKEPASVEPAPPPTPMAETPTVIETPPNLPEHLEPSTEPAFYSGKTYGPERFDDHTDYFPNYKLPEARAQGVIGEGDIGYFNTRPLNETQIEARANAAQESGNREPFIPQPPETNISTISHGIDHELMEKHDSIVDKLEQKRNEKQELITGAKSFPEEEAVNAEIAKLEAKKKLNAREQSRLEDYYDFNKKYEKLRQVQQDIIDLDRQWQEIGPDVAAVMNYAKELLPQIKTEAQAAWYKKATDYSEGLMKEDATAKLKEQDAQNRLISEREGSTGMLADEGRDSFAGLEQAVKKNLSGGTGETGGGPLQVPGEPTNKPLEPSQRVVQPQEEGQASGTAKKSSGGSLRSVEGSGEKRPLGVSSKIEAEAIADELSESFGELPSYNRMSKVEQGELALDLLNKDAQRAYDVAMGLRNAPKGLHPEAVLMAVKRRAREIGDWRTLKELATKSTLAEEAKTMGQRIGLYHDVDNGDPVNAIKSIQKVREAFYKKKGEFEKAIQSVVKNLKEAIRDQAPTKNEWAEMIDKWECK